MVACVLLQAGYCLGVPASRNSTDAGDEQPGYQHTWPFPGLDGEVVYPQRPTPSQVSKTLRAEFAESLPPEISAEEMHEAWHGWLAEHPEVWRSCHGALADRAEEAWFFDELHAERSRISGDLE